MLNACKDELHRRLKVYHSWRTSSAGNESKNLRTPDIAAEKLPSGRVGVHSEEDKEREKYFRVPFSRPNPEQLDKNRGWWYAHFKGQWIARQLELYPDTAPLLLVAGLTNNNNSCIIIVVYTLIG